MILSLLYLLIWEMMGNDIVVVIPPDLGDDV